MLKVKEARLKAWGNLRDIVIEILEDIQNDQNYKEYEKKKYSSAWEEVLKVADKKVKQYAD